MGHPLTVYGKGGQTRGFLDIRDTVGNLARVSCQRPVGILLRQLGRVLLSC